MGITASDVSRDFAAQYSRHARTWSAHPRDAVQHGAAGKTWMAGSSPAMTETEWHRTTNRSCWHTRLV